MDAAASTSREKKLQALKRGAKELEARLRTFEQKIRVIEQGLRPLIFLAMVDQDKCISCGLCQEICPTKAISMAEVVRIDPLLCKGCGLCANKCPQGAISLHPAGSGYGKAGFDAS